MFLLLTLNIFHFFCAVSIVDFEKGNVSWVRDSSRFSNHGIVNPAGIYRFEVNVEILEQGVKCYSVTVLQFVETYFITEYNWENI